MAKEYIYTLMVIDTRGIGLMIKKMVKEVILILPQKKNMKVNGWMVKNTVMDHIPMLMVISIQENGRMEKKGISYYLNVFKRKRHNRISKWD